MFCPNCGAKILDEAKFCSNCGNNIVDIKKLAREQDEKNGDTIRENLGGDKGVVVEVKKVEGEKEEKVTSLCLEKKQIEKEKIVEEKSEEDSDKSIFEFDKVLKDSKKNLAPKRTFDEIKRDAKNIISAKLSEKTLKKFVFDENVIEKRRGSLIKQFNRDIKERIILIYDTSVLHKKIDGVAISEKNVYVAAKFRNPEVVKISDLKKIYQYNKFWRIGSVKNCIVTEERALEFVNCLVEIANLVKHIKE